MKDILAILKDAGVEVPEDKSADFKKNFFENYKSVAELEKKTARITELETQNTELSEKVKGLDGSTQQIEELNKKVTEFEEAEKKRKEEQQAAELENALRERFKGLNGEKKYINEYTEKAVFEDFKAATSDTANAGKSDADIYTALTKDKNIYLNPQQTKIPPAGGSGGKGDKDEPVTVPSFF